MLKPTDCTIIHGFKGWKIWLVKLVHQQVGTAAFGGGGGSIPTISYTKHKISEQELKRLSHYND
jgi:hypothetical protein